MRENRDNPERKRRCHEEVKRLVTEIRSERIAAAEFCRNHSLALSTLRRQLEGGAWSTEKPRARSELGPDGEQSVRRGRLGQERPGWGMIGSACALINSRVEQRAADRGPPRSRDLNQLSDKNAWQRVPLTPDECPPGRGFRPGDLSPVVRCGLRFRGPLRLGYISLRNLLTRAEDQR
jgi:hypothetical protein